VSNQTTTEAPYTDPLREHSFDGIQEYDNPMPRWWVLMFWGSFWFSLIYVGYYHSRDGRDVIDSYEAEMQVWYEKQTAELLAMGEIDEVMIATLMKNKAALKEGQKTFEKTCTTCHRVDGRGDIGPNLTDSYWLGKNTLFEIYTVVNEGRRKMPPWGKKLSPAAVLKVAAYVGSIRETQLPGKKPEGELLPPAPIPDTRKKATEAGSL
jgi:cytochrome c oxidase cbb3-type subunit 3